MKLAKTDESMKRYFPTNLWISFDQIIVHALLGIPHFKGLGMRNLEYAIRIWSNNSYQSHIFFEIDVSKISFKKQFSEKFD
jgi:hypothetical protein